LNREHSHDYAEEGHHQVVPQRQEAAATFGSVLVLAVLQVNDRAVSDEEGTGEALGGQKQCNFIV
jgi:hypothetical protein